MCSSINKYEQMVFNDAITTFSDIFRTTIIITL